MLLYKDKWVINATKYIQADIHQGGFKRSARRSNLTLTEVQLGQIINDYWAYMLADMFFGYENAYMNSYSSILDPQRSPLLWHVEKVLLIRGRCVWLQRSTYYLCQVKDSDDDNNVTNTIWDHCYLCLTSAPALTLHLERKSSHYV